MNRPRVVFARDYLAALVHARAGVRRSWRIAKLLRHVRSRNLPY